MRSVKSRRFTLQVPPRDEFEDTVQVLIDRISVTTGLRCSHSFCSRSRFACNALVEKGMVAGSRSSTLDVFKVSLRVEPKVHQIIAQPWHVTAPLVSFSGCLSALLPRRSGAIAPQQADQRHSWRPLFRANPKIGLML